jgi:hypothetical protein
LNKNQLLKFSNVNHAIQVYIYRINIFFVLYCYFFVAPEITLPPVSVANKTGSNVFLTCEAAGVPLPVVEWVYTAQTGKQIVYPTDDDRISTLVRGGPNAHVLTSWLQIQSLQRNDQGTYTCVASNTLGKVEKSCTVSVESK